MELKFILKLNTRYIYLQMILLGWFLNTCLEDYMNGFPHLFQFCSHIAQGHIPHHITHVLRAAHLLTMTKPLGGVHPIIVVEMLYQLTNHILCLQFCDAFVTQFLPIPI
jgi:hypothetical protein